MKKCWGYALVLVILGCILYLKSDGSDADKIQENEEVTENTEAEDSYKKIPSHLSNLYLRSDGRGVDKIQEDEEVTQNTEAEASYKNFTSYDSAVNFIAYRCFEMSETLEAALSQALLDDQFAEFVSTYGAKYNILTDEEREEYISQHDSTDILKSYEKSTAVEEDLWFGFTDSPICIIRHPIGEGEYAYYEFFPAGVFEEIPCLFRALGKNEEYYFIQWEEKICVITTKREADKLVGIATYCMQGEALYGWMIYQEKSENNSISTKYYSYAYDPKEYGTHWPEY